MDKLKDVLTNLYNSDSEIMIYIYVAIAVISIIIVVLIIISTLISRSNKKIDSPVLEKYEGVPVVSEESLIMEELEPEKEPVISVKDNPVIIEKAPQRNETPMIKPIQEEKHNIYDKPLELESELDLTRPIKRLDSALDILDEFTDEIPLINEAQLNKPVEPIQTHKKPKINLEFTPINPVKIDLLEEEVGMPKTKELVLNPEVLKPLPEKESDIPKNDVIENLVDDSLDTKINIFKHESLAKIPEFDPFKPKTQEELAPLEASKETNTMTLSAEEIKHRLAMLQSSLPKKTEIKTVVKETKEPATELSEILSNIDFDEIPNLYENKTEEVNYLRR